MLPGLRFRNAALCLRSEIQTHLQVKLRVVGKLTLGTHGETPNEAVQGNMGSSPFEAREVYRKITFYQRVTDIDNKRRVKKVYKYLYLQSVNTRSSVRTMKLRSKYLDVERQDEMWGQ